MQRRNAEKHGKSFSTQSKGVRRTANGQELAPRSLRRAGKKLMSECSHEELVAAGVREE